MAVAEPADALPLARIVSLDAAYAASLPRADAVIQQPETRRAPRPAAEPAPEPTPAPGPQPSRGAAPVADAPAAPPAHVPEPAPPLGRPLHPVIGEAPDRAWSVALPGGDPSEAISGAELQEWLESGAATGNELVWRADWPDWVALHLVFPEHVPPAAGE